MAKIDRATQKVFGDSVVATDNIAQFGSLKAATPSFSKDPSIIQGLSAYSEGWKSAVVNNNAAALQDVNALDYLFSRQIAYILQAGISEYDAGTEYALNSYCQVAGVVYMSKQAVNQNHAVTDAAWWLQVLAPNTSGGALGNVPLGSVIAIGNAQAWALPAAGEVKDGYALCSGQTFASLGAGNYNGNFSGSLPQISDSRFIMGSTGIGAAGGQNSYKLIGTDIPQVSTSYTPAGTTNIGHSHNLGTTNVSLASGNAAGVGDHTHPTGIYNNAAGGGQGGYNVIVTCGSQPISGGGGAHSHSVSGTTNIDHSHTLGATNVGLSGTPATITVGNAVGSQTTVENRPLYFSAVYVMRVK